MTRTGVRPNSTRTLSAIAGCFVLGALIAGCTSTPELERAQTTSSTGASESATTEESAAADPVGDASNSPCGLLDDETIAALIGSTPAGNEVQVTGTDLPACQIGNTSTGGIQVSQVPAEDWARSLPSVLDSFRALPDGAVDPTMLQQIEGAAAELEAGAIIPADEACGYFSSLLELQGREPGTTLSVSYIPDRESAMAVSAQQCVSGTYTTLLVAREGISADPAIIDQVTIALAGLG